MDEFRRLFADRPSEPDVRLAMDMGMKAADDAKEAIERTAKLMNNSVEASMVIMLAAQILYWWARKAIEKMPHDSAPRKVWATMNETLAEDGPLDERLAEAKKGMGRG